MSEQPWSRAKGPFAVALGPPLLWLFGFFLVPMGIVWIYSLSETRGLTDVVFTGGFRNYLRTLDPLYLGVLWKSAWIAGATTLACLIAGFPVALAIAFAKGRAKTWLLILVMLPFWTNLLIRTYALMAVLRTEGLVNQAVGWLWTRAAHVLPLPAFEPLPLLHNNFAVVVGLIYVELPFMVLPLYAALDRLDRSLLEASMDLGAGRWRTLWEIAVPVALPGVVSGVIITFIPSLGSYLTPDLLGGPDSQMIANVIERQFKRANDWPFGSALSFMLMYLTFLALAAQGLWSRRRKA